MELEAQPNHNKDNQCIGDHRSQDAWTVIRSILGPENRCADDAADTATAGERRRGEGSFPLTSDIIAGFRQIWFEK